MPNHDHLLLSVVAILALYGMVVAFVLSFAHSAKKADEWEDHVSQVPNLIDNRPKN